MTKLEIVQRISGSHNCLTQIMVSGDSAILMGDALKELRSLVFELQNDINAEESAASENQEDECAKSKA